MIYKKVILILFKVMIGVMNQSNYKCSYLRLLAPNSIIINKGWHKILAFNK